MIAVSSQVGIHTIYFNIMAFAVPGLSSVSAILLMVLSASSCRNMGERKLLISSAICSFVSAALWLIVMAAVAPVLSEKGRTIWLICNAALLSVGQIMLTYYIIRCRTSRTMHEHSADGATNRKESANWLPTTPRAKGNTLRNSLFKLNLPLDRSRSELTRKALEDHFHINRPHTNPDLKLNDLAGALDVSQSDLSAFINREFGINFRRYVNRWRLAEHQRLMSLPSNERKNVNKIISLSGFSNLRHYHRVLETESPEKTAAPKTP